MSVIEKEDSAVRKEYMRLPPRTAKTPAYRCGSKTFESHPEEWQVKLLGRIAVPRNITCVIEIANAPRKMSDDMLLLVFQDEVSKKIFWWTGSRSNSDHLVVKAEGLTICKNWPAEMFQLRKSNFKTFCFFIYGFGVEYPMEDDVRKKVEKKKVTLVRKLEEFLK